MGDIMDIFCRIVNLEIPCYKVYEDDLVLAFLDINPKSNGHTILIPKEHTLDITTIDNDTMIHMMDIVKVLRNKLKDKLNYDGITILTNLESAQDIKHFHIHLIPVYKNDTMDSVENIHNKIMN